ncbi:MULTISPECIES: biotin synthase BioB [Clostridium]|uniref:biotin synthase BioB n=1 Tax=Clostridium TaxID=1485 RepID=UPI000825FF81|nr:MULTISPECIES: biotin synthase BioB [Clostridium]PJI08150.1 biotin synthase BioB [Clostridium sp. CT7]
MKTQWDNILSIGSNVLSGQEINLGEALTLAKSNGSDIFLLCSFANKIREKFNGNHVDLCSVINAKSGNCSEDCAFCSQSCHHKTDIKCYSLLNEDKILNMAVQNEKSGARHCDIATSGLGYNGTEKDFKTILRAFKKMKENTNLKLCACLGVLTEDAMNKLAAVGVERYNHNLETARSFYSNIVSTHGYDERIDTIKYAKKAGMEVCSGMIIGLGETIEQRIEHSFLLKELNVDAVPVNILNPVKGTRLQNAKPLPPLEILKTFAIIRFILPTKIIRYAGGREKNLRSLQPLGFVAGLNGMLIGNYLTTTGQNVNDDFNMLKDLELNY